MGLNNIRQFEKITHKPVFKGSRDIVFELAEVLDIVTDESKGLSGIGSIKIRLMHSDSGVGVDDSVAAKWAKPLNPNIRDWPVKHEFVLIGKHDGEYFYMSRLNIYNSPIHNSKPAMTYSPAITKNRWGNAEENQQIEASGAPNVKRINSETIFGGLISNDFKPVVYKLGDFVLEGRFGQSFKFGSSESGLANLKMTIGQRIVDGKFAKPIIEDINLDRNSLWFTTDESVSLRPSTEGDTIHIQSDKPTTFQGNQSLLVSDRIVFNTKVNEILGFSNGGVGFVSKNYFRVDSKAECYLNTETDMYLISNQCRIGAKRFVKIVSPREIILDSNKVYLGSKQTSEPVVLGTELTDLLSDLLNAITSLTVIAAGSTSSPPLNSGDFIRIRLKLKNILSKNVYVQPNGSVSDRVIDSKARKVG